MRKPHNTFIRNLRLWALLPLFAVGALLMTPEDARAVAYVQNITITSNPGTDGYYEAGDRIEVYVQFSSAVFRDTTHATPEIKVTTGTRERTAYYDRGVARHNGILISLSVPEVLQTIRMGLRLSQTPSPLRVRSGTVSGLEQKQQTWGHSAYSFPNHKVDTLTPTLSSVAVTSSAGNNNTYVRGEKIQVTATFSEKVKVTGSPRVTLKVGSANKTASYTSGSDSKKLIFEYTVATGDVDTDGISILANQLSLNSGTIKDYVDNTATLTHSALSTQSSHKVDASPPTVRSVKIISSAGDDNTYKKGDTVQVQVAFNKNVNVTGTPRVTLKVGSANKTANYTSGSGTKKLIFAYTVASGDTDTDGVSVSANQLSLNSGTIKDGDGNAATLTHSAVGTQASHKVDGVVPTVSSLSMSSSAGADNTYKAGDTIQVTVAFSESVGVTRTPQLTLRIGSSNKTANFKRVNSQGVVFEYTVASGDTDADGISIAANQLSLNGGTIKDTPGNAATLTHAAVGTQASHKVDGVAPTVSTLAITSSAGDDDTYKAGDKIQVQVTFSENMAVTGTPQLTLTIGDADRTADYESGEWHHGTGVCIHGRVWGYRYGWDFDCGKPTLPQRRHHHR